MPYTIQYSNLRRIRLKNNMSIDELASKLNLKPEAIKAWELEIEDPTLIMLKKICTELNVTSDEFIFNETRNPLSIAHLSEVHQKEIIKIFKILNESEENNYGDF